MQITLPDNTYNTYTDFFDEKPRLNIERCKSLHLKASTISTLDRKIETLKSIATALLGLQQEEDDEDFINKPTDHAFAKAGELLLPAFLNAIGEIPRPSIFSDGYGGLKFSWRNQEKKIELTIPTNPEKNPSLYYEHGRIYKILENVGTEILTQRLNWLVEKNHNALIFRSINNIASSQFPQN